MPFRGFFVSIKQDMIRLYNTLSRKKELFKPLTKGTVGLYTCGPTVYNYAHLGNLRTYVFEDLLKRVLVYNGLKVKHVMNITDVGHLTGDMDMGEDKLEVGAKREGKSAWDIAKFYEAAFKHDLAALNIIEPTTWCKATAHIKEQINLIKQLAAKGFTYETSDGVYFNTSKIKTYNQLSHLPLAELKEGARVEKNKEKKNPTDFALWKFSPAGAKRQMEWASPWGKGFPGWHIECSAMSLKYLKNNLDIHCGGIDHINVHHTNEIAQSEAATGQKFFNYWLHGAFLNIAGGKKMAKSADNFLRLATLVQSGVNPLAFRFACLQTHYRKPMEYSPKIIANAQKGLEHLYNQIKEQTTNNKQQGKINIKYKEKFLKAINDDLNLPQALAVVQAVFKSTLSGADKRATILDFDQVLGLQLRQGAPVAAIPAAIMKLAQDRQAAREAKNWPLADKLRQQLANKGYLVADSPGGWQLSKK